MLLVVQRGHVPRTAGRTGAPGEQAFAIAAADRIRAHVEPLGIRVRVIDADVPNESYRGDAFVAVHYDSSGNPAVRGASVGYQTPEGAELATAWKAHYVAHGWSGGFRNDNYTTALAGYYGVRNAVRVGNRRAFIIEAGFHSNPGDAALLAAPGGPERAALAVAACLGGPAGPGPDAPPARAGDRPLRRGTRGDDVRQWQTILIGASLLAPDGADGIFGPQTEAATRSFQAKLGVTADGIVGPQTRAATARLLAWLAASTPAPAVPPFPGTVRRGSRGPAVEAVQARLRERGWRITVDGVFGPETDRIVLAFQSEKGLAADGIAGPRTWEALWTAPVT